MWRDAYLETRVLAADPIELIQILYEHTLDMVKDARRYLAAGDIAARGQAISRAISALAELDAALDHEAGGSISRNLSALYQYMQNRLLTANVNRDDALLAEVESLVKTLGEGWRAIRPGAQAAAGAETASATPVWRGNVLDAPDAEHAVQAWSA
ncbi:MAG TPA: flagellar export chaperone FliS [Bryobacteraceae bacterium]|nr:flagellar export chaperone FliS [Bryobacteraceae bacterium]